MKRKTQKNMLSSAIVMAIMMFSASATSTVSAADETNTDTSVATIEEVTAGYDVNGDGFVTMADVVRLNLFIAEMQVDEPISVFDINNDGMVLNEDSILLLQYLAEMESTTTETTTTTTETTTTTTETTTTTTETTTTTTETTTTTTQTTTTTTTTTETTTTTTTVEDPRFEITDPNGNVIPEETYTQLTEFISTLEGDYEIAWSENVEDYAVLVVCLTDYYENYFSATGAFFYESGVSFYEKFEAELLAQYTDEFDILFLDYIQTSESVLWRPVDEQYKQENSLTDANYLLIDSQEYIFYPESGYEIPEWVGVLAG